jgi:hypothetical protein
MRADLSLMLAIRSHRELFIMRLRRSLARFHGDTNYTEAGALHFYNSAHRQIRDIMRVATARAHAEY